MPEASSRRHESSKPPPPRCCARSEALPTSLLSVFEQMIAVEGDHIGMEQLVESYAIEVWSVRANPSKVFHFPMLNTAAGKRRD